MSDRIKARFAELKKQGRPGLVTFITAGDPDPQTSQAIVNGLPGAGADIIELGMPFSDPMADGPAIQLANLRALNNGGSMRVTLNLVRQFRRRDTTTPLVLMGYYNPIHYYGNQRFLQDAVDAGVDGLIIVDLPPEEDAELCHPCLTAGLNWIRLTTPTSDAKRLATVLKNSSGFVYYVAIAGITGTRSAELADVEAAVKRIRGRTELPIAVGFGIKTPAQARAIGDLADGVVVGSALVDRIAKGLENNQPNAVIVEQLLGFVGELATAIRTPQG